MDLHKNFAKSTLASGITSGATSLTVSAGEGARFPAVPFNATIWNKVDYADPADDPTKEVVRVTGISTDTLTVTRAQEGTSASAHNTGGKTYGIVASITARTASQIATMLNNWKVTTAQLDIDGDNAAVGNVLAFALDAGVTYDFEAWLPTSLSASAGINFSFAASGGLTGTYSIAERSYFDIDTDVFSAYSLDTTFPPAAMGVNGPTNVIMRFAGSFVVNAAGTLTLRYARNTSGTGTSSLLRGAKMRCVPIQS